MRAWSTMFNAFLETRGEAPYTDDDYFAHVDGKPRYEGVAAFLASRGIDLPHGDPTDGADAETVCGLGNRKNDAFGEVLARDGVEAYPGSVELVEALLERGVRVAIVSSSANAPDVLRAAGLLDRFETVVDGRVAKRAGAARQAEARHLPLRRPAPGDRPRARGRRRGRDLRRPGRAPPATSVWSSASTAEPAPTPCARTAPTSWSPTSPSWCPASSPSGRSPRDRRRRRPHPDPAARPSRPARLPDRPLAPGRVPLRRQPPRPQRDPLRGGQRLPRHARQRRGGPRQPRARHLHQRLPRDLHHPARRGGLRLRPRRPDHGQRPGLQADPAVRRRRAAAALGRRPRHLLAHPRLPRRARPAPPGLAHPRRQAGPGRLHPHGLDGRPPPRGHDLRGHPARRGRPGGAVLAAAQPPGRGGRVLRPHRRPRRRRRPPQDRGLRPPRPHPPAAGGQGAHRPVRAGLPLRRVGHDDRGRRRPPADHRQRVLLQLPPRRPQRLADHLPRRGEGRRPGEAGQVRDLPHLPDDPGPRARQPLSPYARPRAWRRAPTCSTSASASGTTATGSAPTSRSRARRRSSRPCAGTSSSSPRRRAAPRAPGSRPRASPAAATAATTSGTPRSTRCRSSPTPPRSARGRRCASATGCCPPRGCAPSR